MHSQTTAKRTCRDAVCMTYIKRTSASILDPQTRKHSKNPNPRSYLRVLQHIQCIESKDEERKTTSHQLYQQRCKSLSTIHKVLAVV